MNPKFVSAVLALVLTGGVLFAQTLAPTPLVVPVASQVAPPSKTATLNDISAATSAATLKTLVQMKALNQETLRKQEATLQLLDELNKAAEQIRIFSKRG